MAKSKRSSEDDDILEEAKKEFARAVECENDNRLAAIEDIKFARLGEQWPAAIKIQREVDGRPCLTINDLPAFIRQVVNDCRQNKPEIKVGPVDSSADPETASIYSDLIRNIEQQCSADLAYDTGVDSAVTSGFGYWRIGLDYAHDDTFDQDLTIERVLDPMSVYGDPDSLSADGSDWNRAFVVQDIPKEQFEAQYGDDAGKIDWDVSGYSELDSTWFGDDTVRIAEYWKREEIERTICLLSNDTVISKDELEAATDGIPYGVYLQESEGVTVVKERSAKTWKVTQYRLTGAEVIETREWPGKFIPIIPIYGEEVYSEGYRYLRSLTRDAQDACRNFNYWRSSATELVALAPKVPFTGPEGMFDGDDQSKWQTANTKNWPFISWKPVANAPGMGPQRLPLDAGPAVGAIQEAMNASDDKKRVMGMYNASLGAASNETSGKAIMARQREGDVSTFHFTDNQSRAIRQTGRVLIDLIPHVYNRKRIVRVLGEDGTHRMVPLNQPVPVPGPDGKPQPIMGPGGQPLFGPDGKMIPLTRIFDLAAGKYDLTVKAGPSFTSRREEAATQMTQMVQAVPTTAPVILPLIAKNSDWPGADELEKDLKALAPKPQDGPPPEMQKQMQQAEEKFKALTAERDQLQAQLKAAGDKSQQAQGEMAVKAAQIKVDAANTLIAKFKAETERFTAVTNSHLNYMQAGLDAQLEIADMNMAHLEALQGMQQGGQPGQGNPQGMGQAQPPPQAAPQPQPMQRPSMPQGGVQPLPDDRRFPMNGPAEPPTR